MKSMKTTTLNIYVITLSGESYYITRQEEFITQIRPKLLQYQVAIFLHYQAMLLHYQSVITLSGVFTTLTGDYYILGCISTLMFSSTCSTVQLPRVVRLLNTSVANRNYAGLFRVYCNVDVITVRRKDG